MSLARLSAANYTATSLRLPSGANLTAYARPQLSHSSSLQSVAVVWTLARFEEPQLGQRCVSGMRTNMALQSVVHPADDTHCTACTSAPWRPSSDRNPCSTQDTGTL